MPVPIWYRFGMSKQIAVRLPEDLVEFVDEVVDSGRERSRASVVAKALDRERRRAVAERDAAILADSGPDPELSGLAQHATGVELDI
ncbi:MAG: ribbon-helix-helix domain-containing protein [Solirubrobacterales bacterium]